MPYFVFEGPDGSGKTTLLHNVAEVLKNQLGYDVDKTRSPGQTSLGLKLRQLVLEEPDIDYLSRQILFMADTVNYYNQYLIPKLSGVYGASPPVVLQDRSSYISSLIYGMSDGLNYDPLARMLSIYKPIMPARLFVLNTPAEVCYARRVEGSSKNIYDVKPLEFYQKCCWYYSNLLTDQKLRLVVSEFVHLDNVIYIENASIEEMTQIVSNEILKVITALQIFWSEHK